ncbi:MAG: hypothetical protein ACJAWO_002372 [Halieaceae bacterium]|jgi:hypothetical protein
MDQKKNKQRKTKDNRTQKLKELKEKIKAQNENPESEGQV